MAIRLSIPRKTSLQDGILIKKHMVGVYINGGTTSRPHWVRVSNAKEFTRSMNPVTEERDYIADEHPTTELTDYKPSEAIAITAYKGEEDFDLFNKMYMKRAIGGNAHRMLLLVYLYEGQEVSQVATYYAETCDCTIAFGDFNASSSEMSLTLYENGSATIGYVQYTDKDPTFTEGEMPPADIPDTDDSDTSAPIAPAVPAFTTLYSDTATTPIHYTQDDTPTALDGTATVTDGGTVSYHWTRNGTTDMGNNVTLTPDVSTVGNDTYTVTATNSITANGVTYQASIAQNIHVTIAQGATPPAPVVPTFTASLADISCPRYNATLVNGVLSNGIAPTLDGTATVSDGGSLSYKWCKADGEIIATTPTYQVRVDTIGSTPYTITATNTLGAQTATATRTVVVTITPRPAESHLTITAPRNATYLLGEASAAPLVASIGVDYSDLSYQWSKADGTVVASGTSYTPDISQAGNETYTLTVTQTLDGASTTYDYQATITTLATEPDTIASYTMTNTPARFILAKDGAMYFTVQGAVRARGTYTGDAATAGELTLSMTAVDTTGNTQWNAPSSYNTFTLTLVDNGGNIELGNQSALEQWASTCGMS